jgi:hypothetical protein
MVKLAFNGAVGSDSGIGSIEFLYLRDSLGYIPYKDMVISGDYQIHEDSIRFKTEEAFSIYWDGRPGNLLEFAFKPTSADYQIEVAINGQIEELDLFREIDELDVVYSRDFSLNPFLFFPYILSFFVSFFALFAFIFLLAKGLRFRTLTNEQSVWFIYLIPPLLSITMVWMILWPGVITPDSLNQWQQARTLQITGWFPVLHTLMIAVLTRIWNSPAVVVGFQAAVILAVLGYGFHTLERLRVSHFVLAALSLIISVWPPFALTSITLWKDTLFAGFMLWFYIGVLAVVIHEGEWLNKQTNCWTLFVSALLVSMFRQNGMPVVFITFIALMLGFRKFWKPLSAGLLGILIIWALVQFPLTNYLSEERENSTSQINLILLGHIAAHINAGTEFSAADRAFLESIVPLEGWAEYDCCFAGDISYLESFDRGTYLTNLNRNWDIFIDLMRKDPMVNLRHQQCAGEITWRFLNNRCQMKSLHGITRGISGSESWIIDNDLGLVESSRLPALVHPLMNVYRAFGFFEENQWTVLFRPALFTFLSLLCIALASLRLDNQRLLLLTLPVLSYVFPLFLINFSPAFRYQYPVILIGLFSLGLPFIPSFGKEKVA